MTVQRSSSQREKGSGNHTTTKAQASSLLTHSSYKTTGSDTLTSVRPRPAHFGQTAPQIVSGLSTLGTAPDRALSFSCLLISLHFLLLFFYYCLRISDMHMHFDQIHTKPTPSVPPLFSTISPLNFMSFVFRTRVLLVLSVCAWEQDHW